MLLFGVCFVLYFVVIITRVFIILVVMGGQIRIIYIHI